MKSIQPLDPEGLKKAMEEQGGFAPTTAKVDVNKIYQAPDATRLRRPDVPVQPAKPAGPYPTTNVYPAPQLGAAAEPRATAPAAAAAPVQGPKVRIAHDLPGVKLYAGFSIALQGLLLGYVLYVAVFIAHLPLERLGTAFWILGLIVLLVPILAGVYMFFAKSTLVLRIILLLLGLVYGYGIFTSLQAMINLPTLPRMASLGFNLWLAIWTWNIFRDVGLYENGS